MSRFSPRFLVFAAAAAGFIGCGSEPTMSGAVKDVWDAPIANASVTIEGITELANTDAKGEFTMPVLEGKKRIKAGAEGHVFVQETFVFPEGEASKVEMPKVELVLYPEPPSEGLFLVNSSKYSKLDGQTIDTTGTELQAYTGVEDPGKVSVKAKPRQRFVYRVGLSPSEIARVGLELHRLEFVKDTTVTSAMGETNVKVNRFVAKEEVEFDLKELATDNHYLIITRGKLAAGTYAFHSEGLLTSGDVDGLDKTPEELRKAYPFEVK
jgi:hypothetical protein